jgi:hypothetical protein
MLPTKRLAINDVTNVANVADFRANITQSLLARHHLCQSVFICLPSGAFHAAPTFATSGAAEGGSTDSRSVARCRSLARFNISTF